MSDEQRQLIEAEAYQVARENGGLLPGFPPIALLAAFSLGYCASVCEKEAARTRLQKIGAKVYYILSWCWEKVERWLPRRKG